MPSARLDEASGTKCQPLAHITRLLKLHGGIRRSDSVRRSGRLLPEQIYARITGHVLCMEASCRTRITCYARSHGQNRCAVQAARTVAAPIPANESGAERAVSEPAAPAAGDVSIHRPCDGDAEFGRALAGRVPVLASLTIRHQCLHSPQPAFVQRARSEPDSDGAGAQAPFIKPRLLRCLAVPGVRRCGSGRSTLDTGRSSCTSSVHSVTAVAREP